MLKDYHMKYVATSLLGCFVDLFPLFVSLNFFGADFGKIVSLNKCFRQLLFVYALTAWVTCNLFVYTI